MQASESDHRVDEVEANNFWRVGEGDGRGKEGRGRKRISTSLALQVLATYYEGLNCIEAMYVGRNMEAKAIESKLHCQEQSFLACAMWGTSEF